MRKSFTRFLGLLALFMVLGFQVCLAGVKTLVPKNGELNAVKTTDLTLTFDNPLSQGTAYNGAAIQLIKSDGSLIDQINVPSSRFTFSTDLKSITIDVQATLVEGTQYYVVFPANVVKENKPDGTTVSFGGYSGIGGWSFTIGDYSKPTLASAANAGVGVPAKPFYPVNGATKVGSALSVDGVSTASFYLAFNEPVKGVSGKYIKIYNSNGDVHEIISASSFTAFSAQINFSTGNLRENTSYYVLVDDGAFVDASVNKNTFAGISDKTKWTFTTRDYSAPVLTSGYPKYGTITSNSIPVVFNTNEKAKVQVIAVLKDAVTNADGYSVNWGTYSATATSSSYINANTDQTLTLSGLTEGAEYVIYYRTYNDASYFDVTTNASVSDYVYSGQLKLGSKATLDVTAPYVVSGGRVPADDAVNVPAILDGSDDDNGNPVITMTFQEVVKAGSGSIIIYNAADNSVFENIDVTSSKVWFGTATDNPGLVKIKPANKLASYANYYIKIAKGVIVDLSGNKFNGYTLNSEWNFRAVDYVAPVASWSSPAHNGKLQSGESVTITFNETISGVVPADVIVEKDNVVLSGFTAIIGVNQISVTGPWVENSTYVVKVLANKISDIAGNKISKEIKKSYLTDSWGIPYSTFDPASLTSIESSKSIKVIFSEPVTLLGGTAITSDNVASLFTIIQNGGSAIDFIATWDTSEAKPFALIKPVTPWVSGKAYTITVSADYQDLNAYQGANQATSVVSATYNVVDTTSPVVKFDFDKTNVSLSASLSIKFSKTLAATTSDIAKIITLREGSATGAVVNFSLSEVVLSKEYTISSASLKPGTTYYLAVADQAVVDGSGNKNVGSSTSFVTASAPAIVSTTPADGATNVLASSVNSISLTFGEAVKAGSLTPGSVALEVYEWAGSDWAATSVASCNVGAITFVGNSATFPLSASSLSSERKYSFRVVAGAVVDVDNNGCDAVNKGDFVFTTKDVTPPSLLVISVPATTTPSADVNLNKAINLTFDSQVKRGTGTITIYNGGTFNQIIDVNSTLVSFDETGKIVSIAHNKFTPNTTYTLSYNAGVFEDLTGNDAIALNHPFTTAPNAGPNFVMEQSFPVDGSDNNSISSDLVLKFDENIALNDGNKRVTVYKEIPGPSWVIAQSYRLSESNVTISGSQINVALVDLLGNSHYKVELESDAVKDVVDGSGRNLAISGSNFYTGDHNGPVATFSIAGTLDDSNNMVKVDRTANIVITFNEAARRLDGTAITSDNMVDESGLTGVTSPKVVRLATGGPSDTNTGIHLEAFIDATNKVITIPASTITNYTSSTSGQQYTIFVSNIEDNLGNGAIAQSYTFWIDDYTAPTTSAAITENKSGDKVVLSVTSSEKAVVYYQLLASTASNPSVASLKANGTAVSINSITDPTEIEIPTTSGTSYKLVYVAQDVVRNTIQGSVNVVSFRTVDVNPPVVTVYGDNGKTSVNPAVANTFTVTFGTDISLNSSLKVYIFNAGNNALIKTYSGVVANDSNGKPRLLKFTVPAGDLSPNGSYYINLDKGIVTDVWADTQPLPSNPDNVGVNEYAGLYDSTTYTFMTKDTQAPYIAASLPYGSTVSGTVASGITVAKALPADNIVVTFNEDIVTGGIGAGDILLKEVDAVTPTTTYTKEVILLTNGATTSISGKDLTINPVMDLVGSKTYQLDFKAGIVKDATGNGNGFTSIRFDVKDVVVPSVSFVASSTNEALNKKPIALNEVLKIKFSENVYLLDKSVVSVADVDSLVTLKDATGKQIAFSSSVASNLWTITPSSTLKSNTTYTLSFGEIVRDFEGNKVPAQSITFSSKITDSPVIVFNPVNKTVEFDQNGSLVISSSRALYKLDPEASSTLGYLKDILSTELSSYFHLSTSSVTTTNNVVFTGAIDNTKKIITLTPKVALDSKTTYYLTFAPYGFKTDGTIDGKYSDGPTINKIADIVDENAIPVVVDGSITNGNVSSPSGQVQFTSIDYIAPVLATDSEGKVKLSPNKNYLLENNKLTLEFNEDVIPGTGDIKIYRKDGTLAETIATTALTVNSDNSKVIEINPSSLARENNMEYYVIVPEGAIVDKSSLANKFAGLTDNTQWIYKTAQTQQPIAVSFSPAVGSTNVSLYDNLAVYFDKDIKLGNSGNISIYKKGGNAFDVIRLSNVGNRLTIDPVDSKKLIINFDRNLDDQTEYYLTIEEGTVVNAMGEAKFGGFLNNSTWTFSTESTTAPKVVSLSPVDNATGVSISDPLTLKITFDADVQAGTGTVRLVNTLTGSLVESIDVSKTTISSSKREVSIPVTAALKENTLYHVFVDANAYTNTLPSKVGFAGINAYDVWNFTTAADVTAPTLTVTAPVAPIAKVFTVGLTFSELVTGVASGVTVMNGTFVVSGAGAQYSITVTSEEQKNVTIVLANTITDLAKIPNAFAGQTLSYTISAPVLVSSTPTGTLKDNHPSFVVTFADNVLAGTGSLKVYKKSDSTLALTIPVTASMISGKVATVTYTYDSATKNGLDQNTDYYVLVDKGFVKDVAGNAFAGITATTTWTFKTGDFATITDPEVNNSLEFKVYPNPFVDYVTVSNASELSKVVVSNIAGQVVKEVVYPDGTIQLNELHSGIYFIALYKDGKVVSTVKLLKR